MSAKRAAVAVTVGLVIGWIIRTPKNDCKSMGSVRSDFQEVRQLFDEMLEDETEGLAMAVYKNDDLIVDLWGGFADKSAMREWTEDTITVTFSTTKAIGALIIAILIVKHWPEFGTNGKHNITVQWIMEHKAGLIRFDGDLSIQHARDHRFISNLIEKTVPMWPPGTAIGYHAITYGWLIDQLVRRVDPGKRGIAEFYRQEIQVHMTKQDEFYLGLPRDQHHRVARIVQPTLSDLLRSFLSSRYYWNFLINYFSSSECLMCISAKYPLWMSVLSIEMPYNNPEVREIENVAALGIGTARGMANVVTTVLKMDMISSKVWERLKRPVDNMVDRVSGLQKQRGYGFFHEPIPQRINSFLLWHAGHGMQTLIVEPETRTVMVVLRNGLSFSGDLYQTTLSAAVSIASK